MESALEQFAINENGELGNWCDGECTYHWTIHLPLLQMICTGPGMEPANRGVYPIVGLYHQGSHPSLASGAFLGFISQWSRTACHPRLLVQA